MIEKDTEMHESPHTVDTGDWIKQKLAEFDKNEKSAKQIGIAMAIACFVVFGSLFVLALIMPHTGLPSRLL